MTDNFLHSGRYYDLFYRDKNYAGEFEYVQSHLAPYLPAGAHLLELGCGTGRHAEHFCRAGYTVTGLDSSADMIGQAGNRHIAGFTALPADITNFRLEEKFDAAFSLFHVISYLTANAELAACFASTYNHLKPGGVFCFDCWYGPAVLHELPGTRIRKLAEQELELTRTAIPVLHLEKNLVQVQYDLTISNTKTGRSETVREDHFMRYFTIPEIEWIAGQAGFTVLKAEEFMTSEKTSLNTWNLFVVLQRAT